jgi:hypothetical protein
MPLFSTFLLHPGCELGVVFAGLGGGSWVSLVRGLDDAGGGCR